MKKILRQIFELFFALVLLVVGILLCVYGFEATRIGIGGSDWISAPATITYTYIEQSYGSRTGGSGVEYMPLPIYSFVAKDGKTYAGSQYSIPSRALRYPTVTADMLNHPVVVNGQIYYNPNNPNESAVEQPVFTLVSVMVLLLGIFGVVGGILRVLDAFKRHKHTYYKTLDFH